MKQQRSTAKGNPLNRYMLKHKRAYTFRHPDHWRDTDLTVEFAPGYIRLYHPRQGEFYITRNAWVRLLKFAMPVLKHMDEQWSVPRATERYLREEKKFDEALRRQKKKRSRRRKYRPHHLS